MKIVPLIARQSMVVFHRDCFGGLGGAFAFCSSTAKSKLLSSKCLGPVLMRISLMPYVVKTIHVKFDLIL